MATIIDQEFGPITLRRSVRASHIRIRVAPNGRLRASLPLYAPAFLVKRLVASSRIQLRALLSEQQGKTIFTHGMQIGKSHTLIIRESSIQQLAAQRHGQQIIIQLPSDMQPAHPQASQAIRDAVIDALRLQAKSHLPKRLAHLAAQHNYSYQRVRFSHASGRWGSCSSTGTISLNIALMKLPFELIDYVLVHELSHTVEMNHSKNFWSLVASADPLYKQHRRALKREAPSV